ncbi:hypothetical protein MMC30_000979 [Trapelia coarctata]|nr:hypothetical protein [Trapelia coarctata]
MSSRSPLRGQEAQRTPIVDNNVDTTAQRSRAARRPPGQFSNRPEGAPPIEDPEEDAEFGDLGYDTHPRSFPRESPQLHGMEYPSLADERAAYQGFDERDEQGNEVEVEAVESPAAATNVISLDNDEASDASTTSTELALPEGMNGGELLVRHLRYLAGDDGNDQGIVAGQGNEHTIETLWESARARQESLENRQDPTDDVDPDMNVDTDMNADADPDLSNFATRSSARFAPQYDPHAAPLTQSTIRDFIARNMNGSVNEVYPSAFAGIPIMPPPGLEELWECSGPSPIHGRCVLDTVFTSCAFCEWRRRWMGTGADAFNRVVTRHYRRAVLEQNFIPLRVGEVDDDDEEEDDEEEDDEMEDGDGEGLPDVDYGSDDMDFGTDSSVDTDSEEMDIDIDSDIDETAVRSRTQRAQSKQASYPTSERTSHTLDEQVANVEIDAFRRGNALAEPVEAMELYDEDEDSDFVPHDSSEEDGASSQGSGDMDLDSGDEEVVMSYLSLWEDFGAVDDEDDEDFEPGNSPAEDESQTQSSRPGSTDTSLDTGDEAVILWRDSDQDEDADFIPRNSSSEHSESSNASPSSVDRSLESGDEEVVLNYTTLLDVDELDDEDEDSDFVPEDSSGGEEWDGDEEEELDSADEEVMLSDAALSRKMWLEGRLPGDRFEKDDNQLRWDDEAGF